MQLKTIFKGNSFGRNSVRVTGSIQNVLTAAISPANCTPLTPSKTGYSFGLGTISPNYFAGRTKFGEFLSTPSSMGVLTPGGVHSVETVISSTRRFYSPFNVSLGSHFDEVLSLDNDRAFTINSLYQALFERAVLNPGYKGVISVSMIAEIDNFYGSLVKRSPLAGSLEDGKIIDQGRFNDWFKVDIEPVYQKHTVISAGIGLDLKTCRFSQSDIDKIFYIHPGNREVSDRLLHNHGYILPPMELPDGSVDYNGMIAGIINNSRILDVKHILDNTVIVRAIVAVSSTQEII